MKVGIYYGSTTGNTECVANMIAAEFKDQEVTVQSIAEADADSLADYDLLFLGSSTWGCGELQDDWDSFLGKLDSVDLNGKKVALFGLGDQVGWADTFVDAMGIINEKVAERGAEVVGKYPIEGYDFVASKAIADGYFVGLAVDESNQSDLTGTRVKEWVATL